MTDDQNKLLKWFRKQIYMGNTYDQALQTLLDTRRLDAKQDPELDKIYNIFVYLSDKQWFEVRENIYE